MPFCGINLWISGSLAKYFNLQSSLIVLFRLGDEKLMIISIQMKVKAVDLKAFCNACFFSDHQGLRRVLKFEELNAFPRL